MLISSTGADNVQGAEFTEKSGEKMIGKLSKRRKEASNFDKLTIKEGQFLGPQNNAENTSKACGKRA